MVVAEIRIELKPGVADPEGKNTKKALELLGFKDIRGVRSIKMFEIEMDADPAVAGRECEEMCRRLLANPVIQKYRVDLR
ncbi:MAG: phosphoribosylformylglycinamidine synthase subunit PurS [Methanomassiliicoccales archaeon]|nr:phosphoribosylformylglycinamidine synthase subunit PurS [Methanomassiliicoccales archaeon]